MELEKFLACFDANEEVSCARYELEKKKLIKTQEDIQALHAYILKRTKDLCDGFNIWCSSTFIELRNIAMKRLTLLNARRGGKAGKNADQRHEDQCSVINDS